ncbi:peptide-methionine (S)-S-oxide reductase [Methanolobus sp. ZRKC2]|uniref:peptide-methionine (S)-S-oxide reductase MsrA n=1 Tax=Methanolobus sp. ZRKC2 TaxID=3125783 RepID=UPI003250BC03
MEKATFATGCFWGAEDVFMKIEGVTGTRVGYTGGFRENPGYIEVLSGKTGHAEAVEVIFDPSVVGYSELLEFFWNLHDPSLTHEELIKQNWDVNDASSLAGMPEYAGSHYRSSIFYHDEEQRQAAIDSMEKMQKSLGPKKKILTEIVPATTFYQAEDEHQHYFEKHADEKGANKCNTGSCLIK